MGPASILAAASHLSTCFRVRFGALRRFDHAAIADEGDPFGAEARRRVAQL
jgi:hypothetical protein